MADVKLRWPVRILSLGAGVQSTTVLLMSCRGILPKLDCAIFADTGWEPQAVYEHLNWLEEESAKHGIPIHRVTAGNIKEDALTSQVRGKKTEAGRWVSMPYRTVNSDGSVGMIRRQCTNEYKIRPIDKFIRRDILGLRPHQRAPKKHTIDQWFGISIDESQRMRTSPDDYRRYVYPLIGYPEHLLRRPMSRVDCRAWLRVHYPTQNVPRSACIACPYHSNAEWREMKWNQSDEWREAVDFDNTIRSCGGIC